MKTTAFVFSVFSLVLFTSCDELLSIWNGGGQNSPITSYPLQIGNQWSYARTTRSFNFRPLAPEAVDPHINFTTYYDLDISGERTMPRQPSMPGDSVIVKEIRQRETGWEGTMTIGHVYFRQESDGLYMYGYDGNAMGMPRPPARDTIRYVFGERSFTSLDDLLMWISEAPGQDHLDSIRPEYPPLQSLRYPLSYGDHWTFRPARQPWRIDKETGPMIKGSVAGQQVRYHEVRWLYDINGDGTWDNDIWIVDQISNKGMIGRTIEMRDIIMTSANSPDVIAKFDITDHFMLTELNVR